MFAINATIGRQRLIKTKLGRGTRTKSFHTDVRNEMQLCRTSYWNMLNNGREERIQDRVFLKKKNGLEGGILDHCPLSTKYMMFMQIIVCCEISKFSYSKFSYAGAIVTCKQCVSSLVVWLWWLLNFLFWARFISIVAFGLPNTTHHQKFLVTRSSMRYFAAIWIPSRNT